MIPNKPTETPRVTVPFKWRYRGRAPVSPDSPLPYSNQEILRRRAELATQAYLRSQSNSFLDAGLNPHVNDRIRREYGLRDSRGLRQAAQVTGAISGAYLGGAAGLQKGGAAGAFVGPKGSVVGAAAGLIVGAVAGGFTGAAAAGALTPSGMMATYDLTRDMLIQTVQNPIGGSMRASQVVGNTMGQLKGSPIFKAAILHLQEDGHIVDNLRKAYGHHEDGFTRLDFSRIRKNAGVDLPFGNALIDFVGEMAMDPINWEKGLKRKITAGVTDGSVVVLSADSMEDPLLQGMDVGTMKKIGELTLDAHVDKFEAEQQFINLIRANPELRKIAMTQAGQPGSEAFRKYLSGKFSMYSDRIQTVITDEEASWFTQIASNVDATERNLDQMRKLTGNPKFGYEQLAEGLQMHFRRKGFNFKPMHMDMLQQQYPTLKRSVEMTNLQNKWLMGIANPGLTAGTAGVKKLIDIIKSGDARQFLIKHFGQFNQGRVPFVDINDSGEIVSVKPTKEFQKLKNDWVQHTDDLNLEREERRLELKEAFRNDEEIQSIYDDLSKIKQDETIRNTALKRERDELFKGINIYDGEDIVDEYLVEIYKKEIKELQQLKRLDPSQQKKLEKLTSLVQTYTNIENYQKIDNELIGYYINAEHTLNQIYTVMRRFENQFKELKAKGLIPRNRGFSGWLQENDDYLSTMAVFNVATGRFMDELDEALGAYAEMASGEFGEQMPNLVSKRKRLGTHPALKYLDSAKELTEVDANDDYTHLLADKYKEKAVDLFEQNDYTTGVTHTELTALDRHMLDTRAEVGKAINRGFHMELAELGINNERILDHRRVDYNPFTSSITYSGMKDSVGEATNRYSQELFGPGTHQLKYLFETSPDSEEFLDELRDQFKGNSILAKVAEDFVLDSDPGALLEPGTISYDEFAERLVNHIDYYIREQIGHTEEELDAFFSYYVQANKQDKRVIETHGPYQSSLPETNELHLEEIEELIRDVYDVDIESLVTKRTDYLRAEFLGMDLNVDGKSVILNSKEPEEIIEYLIDTYDLKHRKAEFEKLKNTDKIPYYQIRDYMRFYDEVASDFIHFQTNQNIVKMKQYLDPELTQNIEEMYKAFVKPEEASGPYKLFGELAREIPEEQLQESGRYEMVRRNTINVKNSSDIIKKAMSNEAFRNEFSVAYPDNKVVGPFFDAMQKVNKSRIMSMNTYKVAGEKSVSAADMHMRILGEIKNLRKVLEVDSKAEYPPEVIDFIMEDLYDKLIFSEDSLLNQREHSTFATGAYFTELNKNTIDKLYEPFNEFYAMMDSDVKQLRSAAKGSNSYNSIFGGTIEVPDFTPVNMDSLPTPSVTHADIVNHKDYAEAKEKGAKGIEKLYEKLSMQNKIKALKPIHMDFLKNTVAGMDVGSEKRVLNAIVESGEPYPQGLKTFIEALETITGGPIKSSQLEAIIGMISQNHANRDINNLVASIRSEKHVSDHKTMKASLSYLYNLFNKKEMRQLSPEGQVSALSFDEDELPGRPGFLKEFKDQIDGFRDKAREPLDETKFINENLKGHLFTKTHYNKEILTQRPFDPSGLVSSNSPITINTPLDMRWNTRQKRLLKTLAPQKSNLFQHHRTKREVADMTKAHVDGLWGGQREEKVYTNFNDALKDYNKYKSEINRKMGNVTNATRIDKVAWAAFDVETLSLQKGLDENLVVQLAAATGESEFDMKVKGQVLTEFFSSLTGISQEEVDKEGRPASEVFTEFFKFAEDKGLIAHNLDFDLEHIRKGLKEQGLSLDDNPMLDTLELVRKLYPKRALQLERNTLEAIFTFLQDDIRNDLVKDMGEKGADDFLKNLRAHNALSDSHMTYLVAQRMIEQLQLQNINFVEEIKHDFYLQVQERQNIMGETLSGSYDLEGKPFQMAEASIDMLGELQFAEEMGLNDNELSELRARLSSHYNNWELNKFGTPSMLDNDMFHAAKDLLGSEEQVFEFYEMTNYFKNVIGLDSTEAKYSLIDYQERYQGDPEVEERIANFVQIMQSHDDISEDDVRKMYSYFQRKRFEMPEAVSTLDRKELLESGDTLDSIINEIRYNHNQYSQAILIHRSKHDERQRIVDALGGYKDREGSNTKGTIFKMMSSVNDDYLDQYVEEVFKYVDVDKAKLTEQVRAYRNENPDEVDWTHPLINKLKGYMGEPGEWEILTKEQQQLKSVQRKLDNLLKQKDSSIENQGELLALHERLNKSVRDEIFAGKDTKSEQEEVIKELGNFYDDKTMETARAYMAELNELKIKTHDKSRVAHPKYAESKIKLDDGSERDIPLDSEDYTINFKQEFVDGNDPELVELGMRREKLLEKLEEAKERRSKERDKKMEEFQKKYGYYNQPEARAHVDELSQSLKDGEYDTFRDLYKKYIPNSSEKDMERMITVFEEEVLQKQKGTHEISKRVGREYVKEKTDELGKFEDVMEKVVVDQDDPLGLITGRERFEDYMEPDMEVIKTHLEELIGKEQLTGDWVKGEAQKLIETPASQRPRVNRLNRLEEFYNMDLQEIQGAFEGGHDLDKFLKDHPEFKLVATVHDNSEASRNPSQWYNSVDRETGLEEVKRKTAYKRAKLTDVALEEKELFKQGEYDVDKPAIKELLFSGSDELQDLFDNYDPSEVSVGIMSINDFKVAKQISYKPFELPGPLDFYYKNILRLQKSDMLLNSSWHLTNFIDIGRKNSQMMEGVWEAKDFAEKTLEAGSYYFQWNKYQKNMLKHLNEKEKLLEETTDPKEIKKIIDYLNDLGSVEFDQYLEKRGFINKIEKLSDIDTDNDLNLGTQVYQKLKNSKSFEALSEVDKVAMINDRQQDMAIMFREVNNYQTSTATTDMAKYIQRMDEHLLEKSTKFHRKVFRIVGTENPAMKANMKLATNLEQVGRLHGYLLDRHLHGTSHDAALMRSLKRHFDYSDKSLMEKYLTLVFPFIAFPTRNALFWQEQLQDAANNRRYYHFINAAWGRFDTETNDYARAMRSQGYIPMGNTLVKAGDSRAGAMNMGTNFGNVATSRLNPLLRAPMQQLQGDDDKGTGQRITEALPLIRRIPQMAGQMKNIQEQGLSHKTAFPGVFGTIYDDSDYRRPVFRASRNVYQNMFNSQGQYKQLSNNAYYRVRQIQNEQHRRRRL